MSWRVAAFLSAGPSMHQSSSKTNAKDRAAARPPSSIFPQLVLPTLQPQVVQVEITDKEDPARKPDNRPWWSQPPAATAGVMSAQADGPEDALAAKPYRRPTLRKASLQPPSTNAGACNTTAARRDKGGRSTVIIHAAGLPNSSRRAAAGRRHRAARRRRLATQNPGSIGVRNGRGQF